MTDNLLISLIEQVKAKNLVFLRALSGQKVSIFFRFPQT